MISDGYRPFRCDAQPIARGELRQKRRSPLSSHVGPLNYECPRHRPLLTLRYRFGGRCRVTFAVSPAPIFSLAPRIESVAVTVKARLMSVWTFMAIYYVPFIVVPVVLQVSALKTRNKERLYPLSVFWLTLFAFASVFCGVLMGGALGFLVMFGPSYATGDWIGLPWFTMLPALGIGLATAVLVSRRVSSILMRRAK